MLGVLALAADGGFPLVGGEVSFGVAKGSAGSLLSENGSNGSDVPSNGSNAFLP